MQSNDKIGAMVSNIVGAYVSRNLISPSDVVELTRTVHATLNHLTVGAAIDDVTDAKPPVSIRKSISDEWLICLEDGKKFKSLKRHLKASFDMTPDQYRKKWGLPADYPMVAPAYSKRRSGLAKTMGLGLKVESPRRGRRKSV